ncbi:hypothetical protein [Paenibacillus caui]|uniref:hypothetical protein n=1 Tax=Paenibacillus caui TaxID=2873927 RepID=UPI001CA7F3A4|nr:hypothetical protein [Paenibacillus caui]
MEHANLLRCTLDLSKPIPELIAVITAVLSVHRDNAESILRAIDDEITGALLQLESEGEVAHD